MRESEGSRVVFYHRAHTYIQRKYVKGERSRKVKYTQKINAQQ